MQMPCESARCFYLHIARLCIITAASSLAACNQSVDLSSVVKLGATATKSADSFTAIARDMEASCDRTYEWEWAKARSHDPQTLDETCTLNKGAADQWQAANLVLISYLKALGALAGGSDAQTDLGIPKLVDGVNSVTHTSLTSSQVSGISSAATSLVQDIYNIRRRNEIAKYAPAADKDLDALVAVLADVASKNYAKQLDFETTALDRFYARAVTSSPDDAPATSDKVQLLQLRDRYRTARGAVDDKRRAIGAYVSALNSMQNAHSALVTAIQTNNASDAANIVESYVDQIIPDLQQIDLGLNGGSGS